MSDEDLVYFRHRTEIETWLAAQATLPEVVAVHYQLATAYLDRVSSGEETASADDV